MRVDKTKWQKTTIAEIGKIITGATPPTKISAYYNSADVCFFKPGDLGNTSITCLDSSVDYISNLGYENSRKLPIGTVLVTCIGIIGKVGITSVLSTCNQQINAIICNENFHNRFIAYNILYNKDYFASKANGPVVPLINKTTFSQFVLNVPISIEEQLNIAKELDAIQAMIDGYKAQIMDLDELIESVFNKTFGDISINDMNWEITSMGKLGNFKNGLNYEKGEKGKVLKFIGVGDFQNNKYLSSSSILSTIELESISEEYLLKDEDIVFVRSNGNKNLVGRCLEVFPNGTEVTYSGFCIRFRKTANIINKYLLSVLTDSSFKKTHILKSNGIGIQNINQKLLSNLPIPIPPIELQKKFESQVDSINTQKALLREQLKDAEQLMAERMQYYFS